MAEGISTWEGGGLPREGEYEQVQNDPTLDMVTLTIGATSTADFMVMQNSTGAELLVVSASGALSMVRSPVLTLSGTAQVAGYSVSVTSTGAIAVGSPELNGFLVTASSKSVLNSVIAYNTGPGTEVGTAETFLAVHGSKAPSYLLSIGGTATGVGAAADNGFFDSAALFNAAPDTVLSYGVLKCLIGSTIWHIPMVPATGMPIT